MPRSDTPGTIRSLRFALAQALIDTDHEQTRSLTEALALLDRAQDEPGADPPSCTIHLRAGTVLEFLGDPVGALNRYVLAASSGGLEEGLAGVRRLLTASPHGEALMASVTRDSTAERILDLAAEHPASDAGALGGMLLRRRGELERAIEVLQRSLDAGGSSSPELTRPLVDALLDLGHVEDARAVLAATESWGPGEIDSSLLLARAKIEFLEGEIGAAFRTGTLAAQSGDPSASALPALCLLRSGLLEEAHWALASSDSCDVLFARALLELTEGDYVKARATSFELVRAQPNNADALLISAQAAIEALGTVSAPGRDAASASVLSETDSMLPGHQLESARTLLMEAARKLPPGGPASFWWRAQAISRHNSARLRYFDVELRRAVGLPLTLEQLEEIDKRYLTWLQSAALGEIRATLLAESQQREAAAAAHEAASEIFVDQAPDAARALVNATRAFELAPSVDRAVQLAYRSVEASFAAESDPLQATEQLRTADEALQRSLSDADGKDPTRLLHARAWTLYRLRVLLDARPEARGLSRTERLPWMLAGVAAHATDGTLASLTAWELDDLGYKAAALVLAEVALRREPDESYVVSTALGTNLNYYADRSHAAHLIEHATQVDDDALQASIDLHLALTSGKREPLLRARDGALSDDPWAQRSRALASVLLEGTAASREAIDHALELSRTATHARPERMLLEATANRLDRVAVLAREAENDPEADTAARRECELIDRFVRDQSMSPQQFCLDYLTVCRTPAEVMVLAHVTVPVLLAAREGTTGPAPEVPLDAGPLRSRMDELGDVPRRLATELEGAAWSRLALLATCGRRPGALATIISEPPDEGGPIPGAVLSRLEHVLWHSALRGLPGRLLAARAGHGEEIAPADLDAVRTAGTAVPSEVKLAIAVLSPPEHTEERSRLTARAGQGDIDAAVEILLELLAVGAGDASQDYATGAADHWALWEALGAAVTGTDGALAALAKGVQDGLGARLDELMGLAGASTSDLVTVPIVVEVSSDLVRFVDSDEDGGHFLHTVIPQMRRRILEGAGVIVPGVRVRKNEALPLGRFIVQVDEVPVLSATVAAGGQVSAVELNGASLGPSQLVAETHPLTGVPGMWVLEPLDDETRSSAMALDPPEALAAHIEVALRGHLGELLGVELVDRLITRWRLADEEKLVASVLPGDDDRAQLRLTWTLQRLLNDGLPITDWRTILATIGEHGRAELAQPDLHRALRRRLRSQLPAARAGHRRVPVPASLQLALEGAAGSDTPELTRRAPQIEFRRWLRGVIDEMGTLLALVVEDDDVREAVEALAHEHHPLIAAATERELVA